MELAVAVQEMIRYLQEDDLSQAELSEMSSRCRRRGFFLAATAALRARCHWDLQIWCVPC